ncbi:MAG: isocitrate lyase/PEP mutase family protein [Pseudomonadota bacterium]
MLTSEINRAFRERLETGRALLLPGAANALSARMIEQLGFEGVYLTGAGVTNTDMGIPDLGFLTLGDIERHVSAIRNISNLPIVVDADTGFGNALNVYQTVRSLERVGASAVQLEDQLSPKRCGHFAGKHVIDLAEAKNKIKAAADARVDPNFLIVARTDACATLGFDAAIDRAAAFVEQGADVTFVEAPNTLAQIRKIPQKLHGTPQLINMVVGGKTPILGFDELDQMGFGIVLYANAALQGAILGMQNALSLLKQDGKIDERGPLADFNTRQDLVNKPFYDNQELQYAPDD